MPEMIKLISTKLKGEEIQNNHCLILIYSYMAELLEDEFVIDEDYFKSYVVMLNQMTDYVFTFIAECIDLLHKNNVKDKRINKTVLNNY
jgi:hypothetical protein